MMIQVACLQLNAQSDRLTNLRFAESLIREAASKGATFVLTPENTCGIYPDARTKLAETVSQNEHPAISLFSGLAQELGIWLLAGSLAIKISDHQVHNRSFLFGPDGKIAATYNKIHLFDVQLPTGEVLRESETVCAGNEAVVVQTAFCKLGLTICYDVRFPELYKALAQAGAQIITVPSAFTVPTGKAHWSTLLRARAIETGSFILAPAQTGSHNSVRHTYGHSMIINPWGEVIAQAESQTGFISAELDLDAVFKARSAIPSLLHGRAFHLREE